MRDLYFDYTAHGDAINTAARLEGVNKFLRTQGCVSEKVVEQVPEFDGRPVGTLTRKGKSEGLKVFGPQLAAGASQAFAALVGQYGEDPLATFHLKRLLAGAKERKLSYYRHRFFR